jgi:hypothetical protein
MWVTFYNYRDSDFVESGQAWLNLAHIVAVQVFEPDEGEPNYSVYLSNGNKYRLNADDYVALVHELTKED